MAESITMLAPVSYVASAPIDKPERKPQLADIAVAGLSKQFAGGSHILEHVDLQIRRRESVSLIGSNGTGKSTLLRCILRLIEPTAGTIRLLGQDITSMSRSELKTMRSRVGLVWQRHNLVPRLSVISNVIHGALGRSGNPRFWLQSLAPREVREEAMHCLEQVNLCHLAGRRCDTLSGGESQRVAIARTLMQRPRMIMADEPAASLDPRVGEELMELFAGLVRKQGITLLFTSHDLSHALNFSDRVVGLRGGRVTINAAAAELDRLMLQEVYS